MLTLSATEEGTYIVTCQFFDQNDAPVVPNSATWTLVNEHKTVINSRQSVVISPLASSVEIPLYGDDLKLADGPLRHFIVEATYNSLSLSNLPIKAHETFSVEELPLPAIP